VIIHVVVGVEAKCSSTLFSNPWEAVVGLYGHLRSCTFGYGVLLGLFGLLIMEETVPIMCGNVYTSAEFIKPIRIATSWNRQMLGDDAMIRLNLLCVMKLWNGNLNINSRTSRNGNSPLGLNPMVRAYWVCMYSPVVESQTLAPRRTKTSTRRHTKRTRKSHEDSIVGCGHRS
jgi:hypothetical protein